MGRTGTAIVVTVTRRPRRTADGDQVASSGDGQTVTTVVELTSAGRVLLGDQGLDLAAVGLTSEEAHGCALLYAHSEILDDVAVPVDEEATEGWEALVDQTGAMRRRADLAPQHSRGGHRRACDQPAGRHGRGVRDGRAGGP